MAEGFRLYFLVYYGLGIVVALITVATDYLRSAPVGPCAQPGHQSARPQRRVADQGRGLPASISTSRSRSRRAASSSARTSSSVARFTPSFDAHQMSMGGPSP